MEGRELWSLLVKVLISASDGGNGAPRTVEDAASDVLSHSGSSSPSPEEMSFLLECTTGAVRFRAVCDGALQGYCNYLKRNRADRHSMYLIAYLVIFKHRALSLDRLRELLRGSTSLPRLMEYLAYLTDADAVTTHSVPLWLHSYDDGFVTGTLLKELEHATPTVQAILDTLTATTATVEQAKGPDNANESSTTTTLTCATTENKACLPSRMPAAHAPREERSSPPTASPSSLAPSHSPSATPRGGDGGTTSRRQALRGRCLPPAEVREMAFTIPAPRPAPIKITSNNNNKSSGPGDTKRATAARGAAAKHAAAKRTDVAHHEHEERAPVVPTFTAKDYTRVRQVLDMLAEVPTTNAALRREAHTHQQRRANEERALEELEMNQHDSTAFEQWREAELAKDERKRELLLLERHLEALESEEKVRAARTAAEKRRREVFRARKEDAAAEAARRRREEAKQAAQQRSFVSGLREELARNRRDAEERLAQDKLTLAGEVKQESEEARRAAKAAEEQRRMEQAVIIQEIRLLRERVRQRQAEVLEQRRACGLAGSEGLEASSDAVLTGMTIGQLHEELERVRASEKALEEENRKRILEGKARENEERAALEKLCNEQRQRRWREREHSRQAKEAKASAVRAAQLEAEADRMMSLKQRLQEKRQQRKAERARTRKAEQQRHNEANLRAADDAAMERERWRQLEQGVVSRVTTTQRVAAADHS